MKAIKLRLSNGNIIVRKYVGSDVTTFKLINLPTSYRPESLDESNNAFHALNCDVLSVANVDGRKKEVKEIKWFTFTEVADSYFNNL